MNSLPAARRMLLSSRLKPRFLGQPPGRVWDGCGVAVTWISTCYFSSEESPRGSCSQPQSSDPSLSSDPNMVDSSLAPDDFVQGDAIVYPDSISLEEGEALVRDVQTRMRRRRYENGHWDAVITGYKEVELPISSDGAFGGVVPLSDESTIVIQRIRSCLESLHFGPTGIVNHDGEVKGAGTDRLLNWMPCHGIDLKADGMLSAHVDSIRYSGGMVAGLSLLSGSIMRLSPAPPSEIARSSGEETTLTGHVDLLLPSLSLYVLSGVARYRYTHELLPCSSVFHCPDGEEMEIKRDRRISIIFRDAK